MTVYEVQRVTSEVKNYRDIKPFCGFNRFDIFDETLERFADEREAMEALSKYIPTCIERGTGRGKYYDLTEYVVEIYEADDNGEFISGSDYNCVYDFSWDPDAHQLVVVDEYFLPSF